MLILAIFQLVKYVLIFIFAWLPDGSTLPTFGSVNLDSIFSAGLSYYRYMAQIFPPFTTIALCATIYIGFKLVLLIIRLVLGSRTPVSN